VANEAVKGLAQCRRAFKALPEITRNALADANEETAEHIRAGAVRRVPVRFAFLQRAITMRMNRKTGVATVGVARGQHVTPDGQMVDPARYAHFQEFGTEHHDAHPFMIPATEEQKGPHLQRVRAAGTQVERDMGAIGGHLT
jgi:HK97 gp10 family phage protein